MTHEINDQFNEYFIQWERITPVLNPLVSSNFKIDE